MSMSLDNPEFNILSRTHAILLNLAAANNFVASEGEAVRRIDTAAVRVWKVPSQQGPPQSGLHNMSLPAIRVISLPVDSTIGGGLNCADDEVVRIAVQILDSAVYHSATPVRTYTDWMNLIRREMTTVPNPFQQDADPEYYDPYVVHPLKRVPAESQSLIRHEHQVALFTFQVMVRHHR